MIYERKAMAHSVFFSLSPLLVASFVRLLAYSNCFFWLDSDYADQNVMASSSLSFSKNFGLHHSWNDWIILQNVSFGWTVITLTKRWWHVRLCHFHKFCSSSLLEQLDNSSKWTLFLQDSEIMIHNLKKRKNNKL